MNKSCRKQEEINERRDKKKEKKKEETLKFIENEIKEKTNIFDWLWNNNDKSTETYIKKSKQMRKNLLELYYEEKGNSNFYKEESDTYYKMYLNEKQKNAILKGSVDEGYELNLELEDKYNKLNDKYSDLKNSITSLIKSLSKDGSTTSFIVKEVLKELLKEDK